MQSLLYFIGTLVYAAYFHPLSKVPGPKLSALTRIPYIRHLLRGSTVDSLVDLHKKYGEVVRISPNEVSFTSGETAWPEIYGFRTGKMKGHLNMQKVCQTGGDGWMATNIELRTQYGTRNQRTAFHPFSSPTTRTIRADDEYFHMPSARRPSQNKKLLCKIMSISSLTG